MDDSNRGAETAHDQGAESTSDDAALTAGSASQPNEPPKRFPLRSLFQLRLRTLLILFTLTSVAAWWYLYHPGLSEKNIEQLAVLRTLDEDIWRLEFNHDGGLAAFIRWEKPVEIRDVLTWSKVDEIGAGKKIIHFAFSPDPDIVAYCENGGQATIVNRKSSTTRVLSTGNGQNKVSFSPDGKWLATGRYGKEAHVWDVASGNRISTMRMQETGGVNVEFHPDGKLLAVGNRNGPAYIFDAKTGKRIARLAGGRSCHELSFDPSGQILAVAYADGMLRTWDTQTWKMLKAVRTSCSDLYRVNWSRRGDMLVTSGSQGKITVWRPNLTVICQRKAPEWVIVSDFTPDGGRLLTAGGAATDRTDRKVSIWGVPHAAAIWPFAK